MPGRVPFVGAVHHEAYRARGVAFAENAGNLAVGHDLASWNPADQPVDAFAVLRDRLSFVALFLHLLFGTIRVCRTTFATTLARARHRPRLRLSSAGDRAVRNPPPPRR